MEGGGPLAVEDRELAGLVRVPCTLAPILAPLCQLAKFACARYVAVSYQLAGPAGYHPPLSRYPFFQGKRAFLRCNVVPISRTRRLSPTANAVPPLSGKEGFFVHHPLLSFMSNSLRGCTSPSLLPCGRRGTACGGGRELAFSLEYLTHSCPSLNRFAN